MNRQPTPSVFAPHRRHSGSRVLATALLAAALLVSVHPARAQALDLDGGVVAQFRDRAGLRRDRMKVFFRNERVLSYPLPDPIQGGSRLTVRHRPLGESVAPAFGPVELDPGLWTEKYPGEYFLYRDRDLGAAGLQKLQLFLGSGGGGLFMKLKGDNYGAHSLGGPVDWVEVELEIGGQRYCGRFSAETSTVRRNTGEAVDFFGGSGPSAGGGATTTTTTLGSTTTTTLPDPPTSIRVPAEWEEQEAVWLQWPGPFEKTYEPAYAEMATIIVAYQDLHVLYDSTRIRNEARAAIVAAGGNPDHPRITWHAIANDNAWMRDNGPTYVVQDGEMRIQDWGFDAWGGAFGPGIPFAADDAVPGAVGSYLSMPVDVVDIVHERGNLEFNGQDAVILNWSVIGDPDRNPGYTRSQAVADMKRYFGVTRVVLIEGYTPNDFTRGHVDGIARFIDPDTVVVGQCTAASVCQPGDSEAAVYDNAAAAIADAGFTVIREPFEGRARYNGGPWFDIDYMNWLVGNGFVIAVGFENPTTNAAARTRLESYYPGRDVYIVDMLASWDAGGGAHCHTNDQPAASTVAGYRPWTP